MIIPFILQKALQLYPDKEAVVSGSQRFSYREFTGRIQRLAGFLKKEGIGKGDGIAILHQNSHEYLETYFAAALIGAVLNPLNFRLSPKELAYIVSDSGAKILISASRFQEPVSALMELGTPVEWVLWTGEEAGTLSYPTWNYEKVLESAAIEQLSDMVGDPEDVVQLYYTSGTTGQPKGVILSHRNVCSHAMSTIAELHLTDKDRWVHVAPLFHLADAWATFAITLVGGTHVIVPDFVPEQVLEILQNESVTITNMVPTMLNMLVNTPGVEACDFSSFRAILSGGAPIAPEVVKKIMTTFKCDYIQTYGLTETSPFLTMSILKEHLTRLSPEEQFVFKAKTGRPCLGILLKVVKDDGTEVQANDQEVGEIVVKGDTITSGYWNKPEETAQALRNGWLHTGDMAVVDREGYINIVDRKKDMIITGGENVYTIEVENALYTHPAVLEAAVIGIPDEKWGETVKAVVVLKPNQTAGVDDLIQHCKSQIAGFKAPKSIQFIPELPKTGSGKIYKKALRENS